MEDKLFAEIPKIIFEQKELNTIRIYQEDVDKLEFDLLKIMGRIKVEKPEEDKESKDYLNSKEKIFKNNLKFEINKIIYGFKEVFKNINNIREYTEAELLFLLYIRLRIQTKVYSTQLDKIFNYQSITIDTLKNQNIDLNSRLDKFENSDNKSLYKDLKDFMSFLVSNQERAAGDVCFIKDLLSKTYESIETLIQDNTVIMDCVNYHKQIIDRENIADCYIDWVGQINDIKKIKPNYEYIAEKVKMKVDNVKYVFCMKECRAIIISKALHKKNQAKEPNKLEKQEYWSQVINFHLHTSEKYMDFENMGNSNFDDQHPPDHSFEEQDHSSFEKDDLSLPNQNKMKEEF